VVDQSGRSERRRAARGGQAGDRDRHRCRPRPRGVHRPSRDGRSERPERHRPARGARDRGRVGRGGLVERRRRRRRLPAGRAPGVGCEPVRDRHLRRPGRRRHRHGDPARARRDQPQPRHDRPRPPARGHDRDRLRHRLAHRRRRGERPKPGEPARIPGQLPARAHGRRHRRPRPSRVLLERLAVRRPLGSGSADPRRSAGDLRSDGVRHVQRDELRLAAHRGRRRLDLDRPADARRHAAVRPRAHEHARRRVTRLRPPDRLRPALHPDWAHGAGASARPDRAQRGRQPRQAEPPLPQRRAAAHGSRTHARLAGCPPRLQRGSP
jgi:hypothetical protein